MRLRLALAMRDRLEADLSGRITSWCSEWGQTVPRLIVGYRKPAKAQDYPFVSIVPVRDQRDLINAEPGPITIGLVCGALDPQVGGDGSTGLAMVDGLAEAVLAELADPLIYVIDETKWIADRAELSDAELLHPNYQIEQTLSLAILGAG